MLLQPLPLFFSVRSRPSDGGCKGLRPPLTAGAVLVWVVGALSMGNGAEGGLAAVRGAEGGLVAPTRAEAAAAWVLGADGAVAAVVGAALV